MAHQMNFLGEIGSLLSNARHRAAVASSVQQHIRNGRGFWPVVPVDGEMQVVTFVDPDAAPGQRWCPDTGEIRLMPLHRLCPADLHRVQFV